MRPALLPLVNNGQGVTEISSRRAICASLSSPDASSLAFRDLLVDTTTGSEKCLVSRSSDMRVSRALSRPWLTQYRKSPTSLSETIVNSSTVTGMLQYSPMRLTRAFWVNFAAKCSFDGLPHTDCIHICANVLPPPVGP